jgi:hypothetical protein
VRSIQVVAPVESEAGGHEEGSDGRKGEESLHYFSYGHHYDSEP